MFDTKFDLEGGKEQWTGETATTLVVSADGTMVAAVNRDEDHESLYRISDSTKIRDYSFHGQHMEVAANDIFANPKNSVFVLNEDRTMLAVSFAGGGLVIFDLDQPDEDMIMFDESQYVHFEGGFCGKYFAFAADESGDSLFGLIDTEEAVYVGGYESKNNFLLKAEEMGIYLANGNLLVRFDPETQQEIELAYTDEENIIGFSVYKGYCLTATDCPGFAFFDSGAHKISSEISSIGFQMMPQFYFIERRME